MPFPAAGDLWVGTQTVIVMRSLYHSNAGQTVEAQILPGRFQHILSGYRLCWKITFTVLVLLVLLAGFLPMRLCGQSFDMAGYYRAHAHEASDQFLKQFPYDRYLQHVGFTDFQALQSHRYFLYQKKRIGDDFLYHLADHFIKLYPVRMSHLTDAISIGEMYVSSANKRFSPNDYQNKRICEIYEVIGYYILMQVANKLEDEIRQGNWDPKRPANQAVLDRLSDSRIYVSFEEGTLTKIQKNISEGKWKYLWDRAAGKVKELLADYWPDASDGQGGTATHTQSLALKEHKRYYHLPGARDFGLHTFRLFRDKSQIGYAVWMRRPVVDARYFAYGTDGQSVAGRFQIWQAQATSRVVVAMTGGFTNSLSQPEGLTVDGGTVVNAVIMPDRHGLVIVEPNGGIRVANLKEESFSLPLTHNTTTGTLRPLTSIVDYSRLLDWCRRRKATVFQTQLLAHGDQLLIDPSKASPELRERRILAMVREGQGTLSHVVFDVTTPTALADIAVEICDTMKVRKLRVEAMLNLDVGSYNIFQVFDDRGGLLQEMQGPTSLSKATNLIVYTR